MTLTGLFYSLLTISIRLFDEAGIGTMSQVSFRLLFAIPPALLMFRKDISKDKIRLISKKDWVILFSIGTLGYAVAVWLLTLAFVKTSLINAVTVYNLNPLAIYAFALIFGRNKIDLRLVLLTILAIYGVTLVATGNFVPQFDSFGEGEIYAVLATICFAWYYFSRKLLSSVVTDGQVTVIAITIAGISSTIVALLSGETYYFSLLLSVGALIALFIGVAGNVASTYFASYGFDNLNAVLASQLLLTEVIFTMIIGIALYGESIGVVGIAGVVILIVTLLRVNKLLSSE